jgi:hypothetical protein
MNHSSMSDDRGDIMREKTWIQIAIACGIAALICCASGTVVDQPIVFATFAEQPQQLDNIRIMSESIRRFGGEYQNAPIWLYVPQALKDRESGALNRLSELNVEIKTSTAPEDALWFFFARKVFASGQAEAEAEGKAAILAWLDDDTIVLQEPREFILPKNKSLGYRPVMHKNIGLLYAEPVDAFWARAYEKMSVPESSLFPMVTPADGDTIRPYFNAGCMVVRPEQHILRRWGEYFTTLYQDSLLADFCRQDIAKRIFIHQAALTGAILNHVERNKMLEFSNRINYPIFFKEMFGAKRDFRNLQDVVTFRYETYFRNPAPDWHEQLQGPADKIDWLKQHLNRK